MQAYTTQNLALATTLGTIGVPFFHGHDGKGCPVINWYSRDILKDLGYGGRQLEEAARDAERKGIPGRVAYSFVQCDLLGRAIKAFDLQKKAIDAVSEPIPGEDGRESAKLYCDPETAAAICCQYAENRKMLRDSWKTPIALLAIDGPSRTEKNGEATMTISSFKVISLNASPAIRERLKLK